MSKTPNLSEAETRALTLMARRTYPTDLFMRRTLGLVQRELIALTEQVRIKLGARIDESTRDALKRQTFDSLYAIRGAAARADVPELIDLVDLFLVIQEGR